MDVSGKHVPINTFIPAFNDESYSRRHWGANNRTEFLVHVNERLKAIRYVARTRPHECFNESTWGEGGEGGEVGYTYIDIPLYVYNREGGATAQTVVWRLAALMTFIYAHAATQKLAIIMLRAASIIIPVFMNCKIFSSTGKRSFFSSDINVLIFLKICRARKSEILRYLLQFFISFPEFNHFRIIISHSPLSSPHE